MRPPPDHPCAHCPVGPACLAIARRHGRFCATQDPAEPDYDPAHAAGMAAVLRGEPRANVPPAAASPPGREPSPPHTVFSVDASEYLAWQSVLLARSFRRAGQPGRLTRLVAAPGSGPLPATVYGDEPARTAPAPPLADDDYTPYNKPFSLAEWVAGGGGAGEVLHVLDPDMVYLRPLEADARPGDPAAERIFFMDPAAPASRAAIRRHSAVDPAAVQPIGVPLVVHQSDLAAFAPRWADLTVRFRGDPAARAAFGWTCEMWACAVAAAEVGLRFRLDHFQQFPSEPFHGRPLVHYSYDAASPSTGWRWAKRGYRPWEPVPAPPGDVPGTGRVLWEHLSDAIRELAADTPPPPPAAGPPRTVALLEAEIVACRHRRSSCGCLNVPARCDRLRATVSARDCAACVRAGHHRGPAGPTP